MPIPLPGLARVLVADMPSTTNMAPVVIDSNGNSVEFAGDVSIGVSSAVDSTDDSKINAPTTPDPFELINNTGSQIDIVAMGLLKISSPGSLRLFMIWPFDQTITLDPDEQIMFTNLSFRFEIPE